MYSLSLMPVVSHAICVLMVVKASEMCAGQALALINTIHYTSS